MSRVVWVTGAGKGIGYAVCLELARRGDRAAASARTEGDLAALVAATEGLPGSVAAFPLDVVDEVATRRCVDDIEANFGPIDIAILNAGTHIETFAWSFDSVPFRTLFDVNVMGVVHGLAALLPRFIERGRGHVVVVSSVAGYRGLPSASAYGASKAAVINMCEALKPELDATGVRMTLVNPGFVRTPLTARNPFPMPFLMDADAAARRLVEGLDRRRFEVTFPRRFTWIMKLLRLLPYALYFPLSRRLVRKRPT